VNNKDFINEIKKNKVHLKFLDKYSKSKIFVCKKNGILFHDDFKSSEKAVSLWSKNFKKKTNIKKGFYSANNPGMIARHLYCIEFLKQKIKNLSNKKICDFGAGEGGLLQFLFNNYNCKKVFGVEHSIKNCRSIVKKIPKLPRKNIVNSSIENSVNLLKSKKIDIAILTWTLCNCSEPLEVVKSIRKILRPNGYLLIAESSRIMVPYKKSIFNFFGSGKGFMHPWYFSFNSLNNILISNGFHLVSKNDYINENDLVLLFKKSLKKTKVKVDNYSKVIKFMKDWVKYSNNLI
jgi:SAM-dependent methyltransferase